MINGFSEPIRQDRNKNGGGILLHISEDMSTKALSFETLPIEGFYVEINLHNKKWLLSCSYNTEKGNIKNHLQALCTSFDIYSLQFDYFTIFGELNIEIEKSEMK